MRIDFCHSNGGYHVRTLNTKNYRVRVLLSNLNNKRIENDSSVILCAVVICAP